MVRVSPSLYKPRTAKRIKDAFARKGIYRVGTIQGYADAILKEKGVEVVDPMTYLYPPAPEWVPPEDIPDNWLAKRPAVEDVREKKKVWHVHRLSAFTEGMQQACLLTKSQLFTGLPPAINDLVGKYRVSDQDDEAKRQILASQVWDNTREKLPKRFDLENLDWVFRREYGIPENKSSLILLNGFLQMAQAMNKEFPELYTERLLVYEPQFSTFYKYKEDNIHMACKFKAGVMGSRPLTPLGDSALVEASKEHTPFDMYPISPLVDLQEQEVLSTKETHGFLRPNSSVRCCYPQLTLNVFPGKLLHMDKTAQPFSFLNTFAVAVEEARRRFGPSAGVLKEPVTILNINCSPLTFNFLVVQLNTLDFTSDNGIKNFVWSDSANHLIRKTLCKPWLHSKRKYGPPKLWDYNPQVFEKFLAMYLYNFASAKPS